MAAQGPKAELVGLTLGYPQSADPGELVVRAQGNRLEAPPAARAKPSLVINGADYNGHILSGRQLHLPTSGTASAAAPRREQQKAFDGRLR
jgi:hypothetical protein